MSDLIFETVDGFLEHLHRVQNLHRGENYRVAATVNSVSVVISAKGFFAPILKINGVNYPTPPWVGDRKSFTNHFKNKWKFQNAKTC